MHTAWSYYLILRLYKVAIPNYASPSKLFHEENLLEGFGSATARGRHG